MKGTKQIQRDARQLFRMCLIDGLLDADRARQVVEQLLQSKRRGYLALLVEFQRLVRLDFEDHTAAVQCAVPLPADLRLMVQARLENVYGSAMNIQFESRPELIGGMRVKVGSDVYDGSVRQGLAELEKRL
jgi:F-type H+-transporting ATPase subunit delta